MKSSRSNSLENTVDPTLAEGQCDAIRTLLENQDALKSALSESKVFKIEALPGYRLNANSQFKVRIANGYSAHDWLSHIYKMAYQTPALNLINDLTGDVYHFLCFLAQHPVGQDRSTLKITNELREAIIFYAVICQLHSIDKNNHAHLKELFMMARPSLSKITLAADPHFKKLMTELNRDQTQEAANLIFDPLTVPVKQDYIKSIFLCLNNVDHQLTSQTLSPTLTKAIEEKTPMTVVLGDVQVGNVDLGCLDMMSHLNDTARQLLQTCKLWQQLYICAKIKVILQNVDPLDVNTTLRGLFLLSYEEIVSVINEQQYQRHAYYPVISCLPMPVESIREAAEKEMLIRKESLFDQVKLRLSSYETIKDSIAKFDGFKLNGVLRDADGNYLNGFDILKFIFSDAYHPHENFFANMNRALSDLNAAFNEKERMQYKITKEIVCSPVATKEHLQAIILFTAINYVQGSHQLEDSNTQKKYMQTFTGVDPNILDKEYIKAAEAIEASNHRCSEVYQNVLRSFMVATKSVIDHDAVDGMKALDGKLGELISIIDMTTRDLKVLDVSDAMKAEVLKNARLILQSPESCEKALAPYFEDRETSICEYTLLNKKFNRLSSMKTAALTKSNALYPAIIENERSAALIACAIDAANYFKTDIQFSKTELRSLEHEISALKQQAIKLEMMNIFGNAKIWFQLLIDHNFITPGMNEFTLSDLLKLNDEAQLDQYIPNKDKLIEADGLLSDSVCSSLQGCYIREQIYIVGTLKALKNKYDAQGDGDAFNAILATLSYDELFSLIEKNLVDNTSLSETENEVKSGIFSGNIEAFSPADESPILPVGLVEPESVTAEAHVAAGIKVSHFKEKHAKVRERLNSIFAPSARAAARAQQLPAPAMIEVPAMEEEEVPVHDEFAGEDLGFVVFDPDVDDFDPDVDDFELIDKDENSSSFEAVNIHPVSTDLAEQILRRIGELELEIEHFKKSTNLFFYRDSKINPKRQTIIALNSILNAHEIDKPLMKNIFKDKVSFALLKTAVQELNEAAQHEANQRRI